MPLRPLPPANQGGGASPQPDHLSQFVDHINKNNYVPVWLHPRLAAGIVHHYGRDGSAIVHPHPSMHGGAGMATGGVTPQPFGLQSQPQRAAPSAPMVTPPVGAAAGAAGSAPLAGIPAGIGAGGAAGRSIFGGGAVGVGGPTQRNPVFAQKGTALDGRAGIKVPGETPPPSAEHDTVHAMLDPGEAVFNKKQLAGIKVKPGKQHLVRADQKRAMKKAAKRAS